MNDHWSISPAPRRTARRSSINLDADSMLAIAPPWNTSAWRKAAALCLLAMLTTLVATQTRAQSGLDDFNPGANGPVFSLAVQPDSKVVVGGDFTQISGQPRNRLARLNPDGGLDTGFNVDVNGPVISLTVQADGKVLVGGSFTQIGGQSRSNVARLNPNGSLDVGFKPDANNPVGSLIVLPDGKVLVGGEFTQIGGQSLHGIARLNPNGSLDAAFDAGFLFGPYHGVFSIAVNTDGKVLVGGYFNQLLSGGQWKYRNNLVRLNPNGSLDAGFNADANDAVVSLVVQADGKALVGGVFTQIGGQSRPGLARLNPDGSLDATFNANVNGPVYTLVVQPDGKMLVGGFFSAVGGQSRNNLARLKADGGLDAGFNADANDEVVGLAMQADGKVLVGGHFDQIGGQTRQHIARLDLNHCAPITVPSTASLAYADPPSYWSYDLLGDGTTDLGFGGPAPDLVALDFYDGTTGTFDLSSGDDANYATCSRCILVYEDIQSGGAATRTYFPTAGTLTLATPPGANPYATAISGLRLTEVTIDPQTFVSTPVPGGACFTQRTDRIFKNGFDGT